MDADVFSQQSMSSASSATSCLLPAACSMAFDQEMQSTSHSLAHSIHHSLRLPPVHPASPNLALDRVLLSPRPPLPVRIQARQNRSVVSSTPSNHHIGKFTLVLPSQHRNARGLQHIAHMSAHAGAARTARNPQNDADVFSQQSMSSVSSATSCLLPAACSMAFDQEIHSNSHSLVPSAA